MDAVRVKVSGHVQGVGFRWFVRKAAIEAGVSGWVRNLADGSVEAVLHGEPDAVDAVVGAMRSGPPHADVAEVETSEAPTSELRDGFQIRQDA